MSVRRECLISAFNGASLTLVGTVLSVQQISKGEAEDTMTALLDALEHAMPAADYLKGLVSLTQHDSQPLRRRALRLFTSRMNSLQAVEDDDQPGYAPSHAMCF